MSVNHISFRLLIFSTVSTLKFLHLLSNALPGLCIALTQAEANGCLWFLMHDALASEITGLYYDAADRVSWWEILWYHKYLLELLNVYVLAYSCLSNGKVPLLYEVLATGRKSLSGRTTYRAKLNCLLFLMIIFVQGEKGTWFTFFTLKPK